jgi:hypothetical protein
MNDLGEIIDDWVMYEIFIKFFQIDILIRGKES